MGLTSLPTKTDGSIGRVKSTLPGSDPSPDLDYYVVASEHEAIKSALVDVCAEVGLSDGSTIGSLVERVDALEGTTGGFAYQALTTHATLSAGNRIVDVDTSGLTAPDSLDITLPTPSAGTLILVRKLKGAADETITLVRAGAEKINGTAASLLLPGSEEPCDPTVPQLWPTWVVTCDGTDWRVTLVSQQVLHVRSSAAPSGDESTGMLPGSTWCETVQDPGSKLHMQMGADSGSADWVRVDAVDVVELDSGDSPYTMPARDRQLFVDTTGAAVTLDMRAIGAQIVGVQYVVTKTNAGTNKITLSWGASTTVNGTGSISTYDLPGSDAEDYGRWHIVASATGGWWVVGGAGLTA